MKLLDVYCAIEREEVTETEAAQALGLTLKDFRFRKTRWGHRLPLLLATLDKIRDNNLSRTDAAATLNISVRQVNHLMETWRVTRPIASYLIYNATSQIKWEVRKKYAIEYIADTCTIETAAENAQVSSRQMRRWVSELIGKHFGMVFKDLRGMSLHRRKRLADEIEVAEGLEASKQNMIRAISLGEARIEEVALDRVLENPRIRRKHHVRRVPEA